MNSISYEDAMYIHNSKKVASKKVKKISEKQVFSAEKLLCDGVSYEEAIYVHQAKTHKKKNLL